MKPELEILVLHSLVGRRSELAILNHQETRSKFTVQLYASCMSAKYTHSMPYEPSDFIQTSPLRTNQRVATWLSSFWSWLSTPGVHLMFTAPWSEQYNGRPTPTSYLPRKYILMNTPIWLHHGKSVGYTRELAGTHRPWLAPCNLIGHLLLY